jgi:hypothetical protein
MLAQAPTLIDGIKWQAAFCLQADKEEAIMRNTTPSTPEADWEKEQNRLASIDLTAQARAICDDILARWSADPRVFVSRRVSQEIGGHGPSHQTRLERTSEIHAVNADGRVLVTVASIYKRLIRKAIASYPLRGKASQAKPTPVSTLKRLERTGRRVDLKTPPKAIEHREATARKKREKREAALAAAE